MAGNYNLGTALGRIVIDGAGAELGFGIAQKAGSEFFDAIERQLQSLKDFGQNMLKAGAVGAGGFAVAGNAAANFEQRLSAVKAVSGASAEDMSKISDAALQIGKDTSFSATEAASAFEELVKAGISVQDTLDGAAKATANLAAAGEIALPRAAEIAANAMNNFNLTGKDMPRIADLVAGAANASAISVEEFAQSLSQVGAVANLAGISFDDISVAIAEMGNAGIKGSDAGTSLKTMLMNLQPVTDAQYSEFRKLGLIQYDVQKGMNALQRAGIDPLSGSLDDARQALREHFVATGQYALGTKKMEEAVGNFLQTNGAMGNQFFDSTGKAKNLAQMQDVLAKATAGMTQEQKLASLETLFGADAIRAAAIMAKNGSEGFTELAASMGKVTAADVAATRLDNVKGSIEKLKGSVETLLIQLGQIFLPIIKRVIDGLTSFVDWLSNTTLRAKTFVLSLGAIGTGLSLVVGALSVAAAAVGPWIIKMLGVMLIQKVFMGLVGAVRFVVAAFGAATGPITFFKSIIGGLRGVFLGVEAAAYTAAGAVGFFGRIAAFAMGPWGALIKIVLLLIGIGITLYNTWEPFRQVVDTIAGIIGGALTTAFDAVQQAVGQIVAGFQTGQAATSGFGAFLNTVGIVAAQIWGDLQKLGAIVMEKVVPALQELWGILQDAFGDAFQQIAEVVQRDLMPALQRLGETFMKDLFPALQKVGEFLLPIIGFVLQVVGSLIGGLYVSLITIASYILGTVLPAIIRFAGPVLGFLISVIANVASFIIQYLITPLVDFTTFLFGTVIPAIIAFGAAIGEGIGNAVRFVGDVIGNVVNFISGIVTAVQGFFGGVSKAADDGASGVSDALGAVGKFFSDAWNVVTTIVGNITNAIITGFTAVYNFLKPMLELWATIWSAIWGVIWAVISGVVGLISKLFQFALGIWLTVWGNFVSFVMDVWSGFVGWITSVTTAFVDWWNTLWGGFANWIVEIWSGFVTWIMGIWNGFVGWLNGVLTAFSAAWNTYWTEVASGITNIWTGFINWIQGIWDGFIGWITGVLNGFVSAWNSYWGEVASGIRNIWQGFINWIQGIWNGFIGWIQGGVSRLDDMLGGGISRAVNGAAQIFSGFRSMLETHWNNVISFFQGIPGAIQGFFAGAGTWLVNAGRQIIDGFLGGLRGMAGDIENFFKSITDKIPQIKGPPEHDKVMLIPAGRMIMKSLWEGLDDGKDAVFDLLKNMNADIPATLSATLDPNLQSKINAQLGGKASFTQMMKAPIVNVAPAEVKATFNAKVFMGDKDITDIVDIRVDEHFEAASGLIETGVNS